MNSKWFLFILLSLYGFLLSIRMQEQPMITQFTYPKKWPKPHYNFEKNPITKEGFELGRKLFYDPNLSRDSSISCSSCHLQYTGFTHVDHQLSHGIEGRIGTRNSPALINLAWQKSFHWDGGVNNIEVQGINPITHFAEMDNTLMELLRRISSSPEYKECFKKVYGDKEITTAMIMKALSQFTLSLVSSNSKYDRVQRHEKGIFFTEQEKKGLKIFRKFCVECHREPLFTEHFFASNGLPADSSNFDAGRYAITKNEEDSFLFKIPTLRNVEFTFPYMHDGRFKKLKDVINYYSEGIDPSTRYLSRPLIAPFHFSEYEKKDLLAFLLTLTDKEFLYNKEFSFPKE
ncbi:MAG: cytochrome c peroxidase [Bacteroidota bacterium]